VRLYFLNPDFSSLLMFFLLLVQMAEISSAFPADYLNAISYFKKQRLDQRL
jgi:hypothetical protein